MLFARRHGLGSWATWGGLALIVGCSNGASSSPDDGPSATTADTGSSSTTPKTTTVAYEPLSCTNPATRAIEGPYTLLTRTSPRVSRPFHWGGGAAVADIDGDGFLDLIQALEPGLALVWGPDVATNPVDLEAFGDADLTFASGATVADYDGDGDLDVYAMRVRRPNDPTPGQGRNVLFRNDGNRSFTDVTDEAGVSACGEHHRTGVFDCFDTVTSSWGDLDFDGDLDLFVGNYGEVVDFAGASAKDLSPGEPSFLFRNDGDGTFTELPLPDAVHDGLTFAGAIMDVDNDRDLDLLVVNDFGSRWPNQILFNEGGTLVADPDGRAGLNYPSTGMGLGVGDFNGDGWLDFAIPEWGVQTLFESRADIGIWVETAVSRGLVSVFDDQQYIAWGTQVADIDNDADLDVLTQFGHLRFDNPRWNNPTLQPDGLYLNDGKDPFSFTQHGVEWGLDYRGATRGVVLADLDRDGWLDIVKRDLYGATLIYDSHCGDAASLLVELRQPGPNGFAVGARLEVETGDQLQVRNVIAGGRGFASASPFELHVGLGEAEQVDRLTVTWPDGEVTTYHDVPARNRVRIVREE